MSENPVDLIFLGLNDAGKRIYDWLCDRGDANVLSLATTRDQLELVDQLEPDLLISVGYDYRVPESVLSIPDRGCVNLHPGYLPYNRGRDPAIWTIVDGTPAGVTLHYMDKSLDTGDIIERRRVEKYPDDTGKDIHARLEDAEFEVFRDCWTDVRDERAETTTQSESEGTFHYQREFDQLCALDLDEEVRVGAFIDRLRALTYPPYDNAYFERDGTKYYIEVDIREADEDHSSSGDRSE